MGLEFGVERMIFVELPLVENFMADLRGVTLDQYVEDKVLWKNSSIDNFTMKLAFDVISTNLIPIEMLFYKQL